MSEGEGEEAFGIHNQRPGDADAAGPGPHSENQGLPVSRWEAEYVNTDARQKRGVVGADISLGVLPISQSGRKPGPLLKRGREEKAVGT